MGVDRFQQDGFRAPNRCFSVIDGQPGGSRGQRLKCIVTEPIPVCGKRLLPGARHFQAVLSDGWPSMVGDWFDFLRWRRKVGGAFHLAFTSPNTLGQVTSLMASRAKALLLKERLVGSTPTPVTSATVADLDWLAPTP